MQEYMYNLIKLGTNRIKVYEDFSCANAGVHCRTEQPGLLYDGDERPADAYAILPEGDTALDVVFIDNRRPSDSEATKAKRRRRTRIMAKIADGRRKRRKTNGNGRTMQDRLRDHNINFTPLAFEIGRLEQNFKKAQ